MTFLSRELYSDVSFQMKRHTKPIQAFSPQGIARKQNTTRDMINEKGRGGLLDSFDQIDEYQGSAACEFTRAHTRLAHVAYLAPLFEDALHNGLPVYAVRSSSQKHICSPGELHNIDPRAVMRKVEDLPEKVDFEHDEYFGVSVLETVLREMLDGTCYWMPHIHSIFAGLSREVLQDALKPRRLIAPFSSSPQIHIKELTCSGHIIQDQVYDDKAIPETKREYINKDGKVLTCREGIKDDALRAEFHQWFARHDLNKVVRYINISQVVIQKMHHIEMEKLCNRFIKICKVKPSHVLKECSCNGD
jgi:hypothetical protein